MRRSIALAWLALALIAGQGGSAIAQSDAAPATSLSAICAFEFDLAEQAALAGGGALTAATGGVVRALEVDDADDATDRATEPPAGGLGTALDATIRACASVAEWMTAAGLFPGALRSLDPIATLTARCSDPVADLASYATCRSLVDSLATPAPAAPTPAPPRPVAGTERGGTDTSGGETASGATGSEASTPEEKDRQRGRRKRGKADRSARDGASKPGRVTITRQHRARIPGATEIRYFRIKGDTPAKLLRANQRQGGRHCRNHQAIACVLLSWDISITKAADPETGRCIIGKASTTLRSVVFLPRWIDRKGAPPALVRWWRDVVRESAIHEREHIRIQQRHLAAFRREAKGAPCGSATIIFNRHARQANRAQAEFDRVEYQKPLPPLPASLLR